MYSMRKATWNLPNEKNVCLDSLLETRCLNNTTNVAEYTRFGQLSPLPDVVTTLVQT
jgi:hypothetical protein